MIRAALPHGTLGEDRIVWSVVDEHLDEAEFLASLWASARRSGLYALAELERGPERRLLAHVDGLESNGPLALERVVWPVVDDAKAEPMRLCAAALTLLESGDFRVLDVLEGAPEPDATGPDATEPDADGDGDEDLAGEANAVDEGGLDFGALGPEALEEKRLTDLKELDEQLAATTDEAERGRLLELQAMLQADAPDPAGATEDAAGEQAEPRLLEPEPEVDPRLEPLGLALALASHPQLGDHIRSRAAKADGPTLALLLRACGDRGLHPGPALDRGLVHEEPAVVCAALRAATFGDRPRLLGAVEGCLQHRQAAVRAVALDTGMMWGSRLAWELALASYKQPEAANARLWIACLGEDRHAEALARQLADPALRHDTLWALGFSGRVPALIACLALLDDADQLTRRLAGEAVAAIVGLDPEDEALWEEPAVDEAEVDQDDLDADLVPTPESELPLPNAAAIRERWKRLESAFVPGKRYILGKPVEREGPGWALSLLSCRRVDVVAREIVARSQGVGRWPWQARAGRHMQAVGVLAELGRQAGAIQGDRR